MADFLFPPKVFIYSRGLGNLFLGLIFFIIFWIMTLFCLISEHCFC